MRKLLLAFIFTVSALCAEEKASELPKEEQVETSHTLTINGANMPYKATAGTLLLKDEKEKDKVKASIFYVAYTREDDNAAQRPITFCFNGGPGSSSVWLHMGVLGPKRLAADEVGYPLQPPHLVDNEYTLLDLTDLVFIDPVSTGYSRSEDSKQFYGVEEDIKCIAEFIRLYVTHNNRWGSPKFLAGESYGTIRAVGLADYLHEKMYMNMNGVMLISACLNMLPMNFDEGNDIPYLTYLPTYAATAWYHKKLSKEAQDKTLDALLRDVDQFAVNEYSSALYKGDTLPDKEKREVAKKLSSFIGISEGEILLYDLRINLSKFATELLKNERQLVGRFDGRMSGQCTAVPGTYYTYDPSMDSVLGPFTEVLNRYMRTELKWEKDEQYRILEDLWSSWNFNSKNKYLSVMSNLQDVMTKNPYMRVFIASGIYDLATPFAATDYNVSHLGLDPSLRDHLITKNYEAGHMMYLHKPTLVKLRDDLAKFLRP